MFISDENGGKTRRPIKLFYFNILWRLSVKEIRLSHNLIQAAEKLIQAVARLIYSVGALIQGGLLEQYDAAASIESISGFSGMRF